MDVVIPVSTILLAALVHATLQISLGCLLLLYHASKGKHVRKKTRHLVGSYISGIGIMSFLGVCAMCYVVTNLWHGPLGKEWLLIIVGILSILTFGMWLFYYRWGKGSELWIPRVVANFIDRRAKATANNTEAFSLGILTCFAELPFSLILFVVAANSVLELPGYLQLLLVACYSLLTVLPMLIMCFAFKKGRTVVEVQKWRVKHKNFLRIIAGVGFLVLAIFIFSFQVRGVL